MSLGEASKQARTCNSEYNKTRLSVLRMYNWSFASKRVILAPDPDPPVFEFSHAFQLPSDYVRVVELFEYEGKYRVEGRQLLADTDTIYLKYVADVEDFAQADPLFIEVLEWQLAYNICRYLTESSTVRQEAFQGLKAILPMAKFVQSTEHSQPIFEANDLIESRNRGSFVRDPMT